MKKYYGVLKSFLLLQPKWLASRNSQKNISGLKNDHENCECFVHIMEVIWPLSKFFSLANLIL